LENAPPAFGKLASSWRRIAPSYWSKLGSTFVSKWVVWESTLEIRTGAAHAETGVQPVTSAEADAKSKTKNLKVGTKREGRSAILARTHTVFEKRSTINVVLFHEDARLCCLFHAICIDRPQQYR